MRESEADIAALQDLLDRSYAGAGAHLLNIHTPERRLNAEQVAERLEGMCLLVLATVTSDGRPITGPVDGIFYRGSWYFGTAPEAMRSRHIAARPQVSATHLPSEELAVVVHGQAHPIDVHAPEHAGFRQVVLDTYIPRYGPEWEDFLNSVPAYTRIDADRMFALQVTDP